MLLQPVQIGPPMPIAVFLKPVRAGFASPADDYLDAPIDLSRTLIQKPLRGAADLVQRVRSRSEAGHLVRARERPSARLFCRHLDGRLDRRQEDQDRR